MKKRIVFLTSIIVYSFFSFSQAVQLKSSEKRSEIWVQKLKDTLHLNKEQEIRLKKEFLAREQQKKKDYDENKGNRKVILELNKSRNEKFVNTLKTFLTDNQIATIDSLRTGNLRLERIVQKLNNNDQKKTKAVDPQTGKEVNYDRDLIGM